MTTLAQVILRDITGNRPAAGTAGRLFFDTTLSKWQRDTGATWEDCEADLSGLLDEAAHDALDHTGLTGVPSIAGLLDEGAHDALDHTGLTGVPSIAGLLDETAHDLLDHTGLTGVLSSITDHDHTGDAGDGGKIDLTLTAAPSSDTTASGIKIPLTAAENLAFGDVCYIDSNGKAAKADADAAASALVVVMAIEAISTDASGSFLVLGIARNDAWAWTVGGALYLDTATAGGMTQTPPSGTDDAVIVLGVATHADRVLFRPSGVIVEHT